MRGGVADDYDYKGNFISLEKKAQDDAINSALINSLRIKEQERRAALSPEEKNREDDRINKKLIKDYIDSYYKYDLLQLYKLADLAISKCNGLLSTKTSLEDTYINFKQTEFGEELKNFLKKINQKSSIMGKSFSCDNYIDRTFSNIIWQGFGIKESSIDCRGSSQIWKLYKYLIKITSKYLQAFSESDRENFKKEFKKELSRNLVLICSGIEEQEDVKKMIRDSIEEPEIKDALLKIYNELDTLFSNDSLIIKGSLLNNGGFKKKLIDFLRIITLNKCNRAIKAIFVNNDNPYFTGIFCSSKNKIQELYNYLNMFEYKKDDEISNKENQKQVLKKKLSESLIDISFRDKTIQKTIKETEYLSSQTFVPVNKNQEDTPQLGGNTKITKSIKKDILGKSRCIYKKSGDRKQYIKHKGALITISEYKKLMAAKNTK